MEFHERIEWENGNCIIADRKRQRGNNDKSNTANFLSLRWHFSSASLCQRKKKISCDFYLLDFTLNTCHTLELRLQEGPALPLSANTFDCSLRNYTHRYWPASQSDTWLHTGKKGPQIRRRANNWCRLTACSGALLPHRRCSCLSTRTSHVVDGEISHCSPQSAGV